jgi:IS5 family transposase
MNCLRLDSTVVKSNIAPPLDSQLLDDGIRVLSRLIAKSRDVSGVKITFNRLSQTIQILGSTHF